MNTTVTPDNVDAAEVAKFEALASRWRDPACVFKPLHEINPLRLDFIDQHSPLAGQQVLDVGCGGGILAESMAARGAAVTGIDAGATPLAVARLHLQESGLKVSYQHRTAEQLAVTSTHQFDIVTCMELLEHVPDPSSTVAACGRLVKPGGTVYFSTINRTPKAWLLAIVGAEYILSLLPRGTHNYEKFVRPSELDAWCRGNALTTTQFIGLHYNPVTGKYWLAPGVDVNYMAHAVRG